LASGSLARRGSIPPEGAKPRGPMEKLRNFYMRRTWKVALVALGVLLAAVLSFIVVTFIQDDEVIGPFKCGATTFTDHAC
jgi:hypothetical protein